VVLGIPDAAGERDMTENPIIDEVRRAGDAFFKQFNYDLKAAFDELRRLTDKSARPVVSRSARKPKLPLSEITRAG
jgi:hypothetical protein